MLENPFYYTEEAKRQRSYWRRVAAVALAGVGLTAALLIAFYPRQSRADPIAQAAAGNGVQVVLHSEPCALKEITNLPNRATWTEAGASFEGCFGVRPETGVVIAYFTDKTVVAIPNRRIRKGA